MEKIKITLSDIKLEAKELKKIKPKEQHTKLLNLISQEYGFEKYEILKSKCNNGVLYINLENISTKKLKNLFFIHNNQNTIVNQKNTFFDICMELKKRNENLFSNNETNLKKLSPIPITISANAMKEHLNTFGLVGSDNLKQIYEDKKLFPYQIEFIDKTMDLFGKLRKEGKSPFYSLQRSQGKVDFERYNDYKTLENIMNQSKNIGTEIRLSANWKLNLKEKLVSTYPTLEETYLEIQKEFAIKQEQPQINQVYPKPSGMSFFNITNLLKNEIDKNKGFIYIEGKNTNFINKKELNNHSLTFGLTKNSLIQLNENTNNSIINKIIKPLEKKYTYYMKINKTYIKGK
jgi:hypothetical protein